MSMEKLRGQSYTKWSCLDFNLNTYNSQITWLQLQLSDPTDWGQHYWCHSVSVMVEDSRRDSISEGQQDWSLNSMKDWLNITYSTKVNLQNSGFAGRCSRQMSLSNNTIIQYLSPIHCVEVRDLPRAPFYPVKLLKFIFISTVLFLL